MDGTKEKSSRSGSKTNLNDSTLPLLMADHESSMIDTKGETPEKERIELETRSSSEEKGDEGKEKKEGDDNSVDQHLLSNDTDKDEKTDGEEKEKDKKKKKKEKKEKVKGHKRSISCADTLTVGLNLLDRDEKHINDQINLVFEDVMAEPDATHGFDNIWRLTYVVFSGTKHWVYRILACLLALPCGIAWGLIFSLLTLANVWLITPLLRTLDVVFYIVRRIWSGIIQTLLDPIFKSIGLCLGSINLSKATTRIDTFKEP